MALRRKKPEVIVFEEPAYSPRKSSKEAARERNLFLRGDVSEIFSSSEPSSKEHQTSAEPSAVELDVKATLREVQGLAASGSTGKTRRKFEEAQLRTLGAKPPKSEYVPYPHYQRMAKARREKEKRLAEEMKVSQKKKRKRDRGGGAVVKGRGRWKDSIKSLEPAVGKFKNGILTLSSKDLTRVKS